MNSDPDKTHYWIPYLNMFISKNDDLIIKIELGGLLAEDLVVKVENKSLRIKGVRHDSEMSDSRQILVRDVPAGPFECVMEIPVGFDLSASNSAYLKGMLRTTVPPKARPSGTPWSPHRN
jgi:HSP20 family molecular chaperone IbpA